MAMHVWEGDICEISVPVNFVVNLKLLSQKVSKNINNTQGRCFRLNFCFTFMCVCLLDLGFPGGAVGKESACKARDPGSIPGSGRSPGEAIGYPLQDSWASLVA